MSVVLTFLNECSSPSAHFIGVVKAFSLPGQQGTAETINFDLIVLLNGSAGTVRSTMTNPASIQLNSISVNGVAWYTGITPLKYSGPITVDNTFFPFPLCVPMIQPSIFTKGPAVPIQGQPVARQCPRVVPASKPACSPWTLAVLAQYR